MYVIAQPAGELVFGCETFPRDFSREDLDARFGSENVVDGPVIGRDDGPQDGTIIFPDDPSRRVFIWWSDPESKSQPFSVFVRDAGSEWRTINDVSIGDDLLSIERANGWPFRLRSLSFEGGGRVVNWGQGRLVDHDAGMPTCRVAILFRNRSFEGIDLSLVRQVASGGELSSGHLALQELNPEIGWMSISYPIGMMVDID